MWENREVGEGGGEWGGRRVGLIITALEGNAAGPGARGPKGAEEWTPPVFLHHTHQQLVTVWLISPDVLLCLLREISLPLRGPD